MSEEVSVNVNLVLTDAQIISFARCFLWLPGLRRRKVGAKYIRKIHEIMKKTKAYTDTEGSSPWLVWSSDYRSMEGEESSHSPLLSIMPTPNKNTAKNAAANLKISSQTWSSMSLSPHYPSWLPGLLFFNNLTTGDN